MKTLTKHELKKKVDNLLEVLPDNIQINNYYFSVKAPIPSENSNKQIWCYLNSETAEHSEIWLSHIDSTTGETLEAFMIKNKEDFKKHFN